MTVAVDSNALTYLVEPMEPGYDPALDDPVLVQERIAMVRILLYGDLDMWVSPTVKQESREIPSWYNKVRHDRPAGILLLDQPIDARAYRCSCPGITGTSP